MLEKDYVGLDLDFEYIPADDRAAFTAFVENAVSRLSPYGFFVNTDLAPKTSDTQPGLLYEAHDYAALGAASDRVFLMTYEWGYTYDPRSYSQREKRPLPVFFSFAVISL